GNVPVTRGLASSARLQPSARIRFYLRIGRNGLRQELERIDQLAVGENLVVKMRAGRAAGRSDVADDLAALHGRARLHREGAQVAVARREAEGVLDDDQVAVVAGIRRRVDDAVSRRENRLTFLRGDVETLMEG